MKKLINPGPGAAPILVVFAVAAICFYSCGNDNQTPSVEAVTAPQTQIAFSDSSGGTVGSPPGGGTKGATLKCVDPSCLVSLSSSALPTAAGEGSKYELQATAVKDIKAGTIVHFEVQFVEAAKADTAMKK